MRNKYTWMMVDLHNMEFPLEIADSIEELAELAGVTVKSIRETMCRAKKRGWKCKYIKVECDDDREEIEDMNQEKTLNSWSDWILEYCAEKNITMVEFAEITGVKVATVYGWVEGHANGSIKTIMKCMDALGVEMVTRKKAV